MYRGVTEKEAVSEQSRFQLAQAGYAQSPLRYPGGKTRAVAAIRRYIPADITAICSPFFGGGSLELSCAADGIAIYGSDAFSPVADFWQEALTDSAALSDEVSRYFPLTRESFYDLQRSYAELGSRLERAAVFFVLNRASFSGITLSGGMSPGHPRFTTSAIDRLRQFSADNVQVVCADYRVALAQHTDKFLYLDPPYAIASKLYGVSGDMHAGFQHEQLAQLLRQRTDWLLSYNDCALVRELYSDYEIVEPKWAYGMNNGRRSKEVLIIG